ncbi:epoxide hydrolase [Colletotrichum costaricense]|uniref:Epoxide hydrolase n=1 Tax=Colletotrichum costaricense TaxID=1209916 RepID=A0AAI9Z1Y3_9PEZI|nr:epoxide hydrolase [Colletotrichum costaricense]KAK1532042.1 epoxide hydrolase [Colletotrichum costaricense]
MALLEEFNLYIPDSRIEDFASLLSVSKIGSETWCNKHNNKDFGTTRNWLAEAKDAWLELDWRKLMNELMITLGFDSGYVAQGGDIGSFLARILLANHPQCKAFYINMLALLSQNELLTTVNITEDEAQHVQRMLNFSATGSSYLLEHGLRPSTIGLVLSSSPLAMLAWIGEKFLEWPDSRYPLSVDTILTMVSFYWYTDTFPRSMYPYRALASAAAANVLFSVATSKEKPFGYSVFPAENILLPKAWAEKAYPNLVFYKRNDKGGHFAALEQPRIFLQNIEQFLAVARPLIGL